MIGSKPGGSGPRDSVADVSRLLLEQAYPEQTSAWIEEHVTVAVDRINRAVPPATPPNPLVKLRRASVRHLDRLRPKRPVRQQVLAYRVQTTTTSSGPSTIEVHIQNAGPSPVEEADYLAPLRLRLPGREVLDVTVTQSQPQRLSAMLPADPGFITGLDRIILPAVTLHPGHSFTIAVKASNTATGQPRGAITVDGRLRHGRIVTPEPTAQPPAARVSASDGLAPDVGK